MSKNEGPSIELDTDRYNQFTREQQPESSSPPSPQLRGHQKLAELLSKIKRVFIVQKREVGEVVLGWEQLNRYEYFDENNNLLGRIEEESTGASSTILRQLTGSHRPFHMSIRDAMGEVLVELSRKFFFYFSELKIQTRDGRYLGQIRRRFKFIGSRYDVEDHTGRVFAVITKPIWRFWQFKVESVDGRPAGAIAKKWSGGLTELMTDADRFGIEFVHKAFSGDQRLLLFSAAIAIDFDFFENNHKR